MTRTESAVWIGLVGVIPTVGNTCLDGARGAYVYATAWVAEESQFCSAVAAALTNFLVTPFEFEGVEPFTKRFDGLQPPNELRLMGARTLRKRDVNFSKFYLYDEVDA